MMPYAKSPFMRGLKRQMLAFVPGMITCEAFESFINDYLDGTLPQEQLVVFNRHLKLCPECVDFLREYEKLRELPRKSFDAALAEVLPGAPDDLVKAVLESRPRSTR